MHIYLRKTYVLLLMIFAVLSVSASNRYALLVGISQYNKHKTSWDNINGVNDVHLIAPLLEHAKFNVTILTDENATAGKIRKEFDNLISHVQNGDTVYLHFSCHGQPIEDTNGDEDDYWDESLIPIDAHMIYSEGVYMGENHIKDDELENVLDQLRKKIGRTGCIYVVIDACHAGTAVRNENIHEGLTPCRGTNIGFSKTKIYRPKHTNESSYITFSNTNNELANIIVLEACLSTQRNQEILINEKLYGPLSYAVATIVSKYGLQCNEQWISNIQLIMKGVLPTWSTQQMVVETNIQ